MDRSKIEEENLAAHSEALDRHIRALWGVITALALLVFAAASAAVWGAITSDSGRSETLQNREIGWERGAIDCLVSIIDNERTELGFTVSPYCLRPEVVRHYPLAACQVVGDPPQCGDVERAG